MQLLLVIAVSNHQIGSFNDWLINIVSFSPSVSGYDRSIPGIPRYRVLGSEDTGQFSLEINNVNITDDASYECQVGPANYNKPIRAAARLNVLRKHAI